MDVKMQSIDAIGLSVRSSNALHRAGVHTVGDMLERTEEDLSQVRNLGKKSLEEILEKIDEYKKIDASGDLPEEEASKEDVVLVRRNSLPAGAVAGRTADFPEPEDFGAWLMEEDNRQLFLNWLKDKKSGIEELELLSTKAYNLLAFSEYEFIYQIAFLSETALMEIPRMDEKSAREIAGLIRRYILEKKGDFFASLAANQPEKAQNASRTAEASAGGPSIFDLLTKPEYRETVLKYVQANDQEIERTNLSKRAKNRLIGKEWRHLSDIIFMTQAELGAVPQMGAGSVKEILELIHGYMERNLAQIQMLAAGDGERSVE